MQLLLLYLFSLTYCFISFYKDTKIYHYQPEFSLIFFYGLVDGYTSDMCFICIHCVGYQTEYVVLSTESVENIHPMSPKNTIFAQYIN